MTALPDPVEALAQVKVLAAHREMFRAMLEEAVAIACSAGVRRDELADALGVHRATFYRQFPGRVSPEGATHVG